MTDRTTKALLFAVALGLWVNLVSGWLRPVPVEAQGLSETYLAYIQSDISNINTTVSGIRSDVRGIRNAVE